jgi:hypothetical protein
MPQDLGHKKMKLKWGDIRVRTRGDLTAVVWTDKRDIHMLTNIHNPPAEDNFCDEKGNTIKPLIVEDYNHHMGYVDKGDRMANSYSVNCRTWKWTKKLFFHLLHLAVLNSYILLSLCVKQITHREFGLALVRNMLVHAGQQPSVQRPPGMPANVVNKVSRLDTTGGNKHWPVLSNQLRCRVCSACRVTRKVSAKCQKCEVGLCVDKNCFLEYHTKTRL